MKIGMKIHRQTRRTGQDEYSLTRGERWPRDAFSLRRESLDNIPDTTTLLHLIASPNKGNPRRDLHEEYCVRTALWNAPPVPSAQFSFLTWCRLDAIFWSWRFVRYCSNKHGYTSCVADEFVWIATTDHGNDNRRNKREKSAEADTTRTEKLNAYVDVFWQSFFE